MRIELTLNGTAYAIDVEDKCYIPIKFDTVQDKTSPNFGKVSEKQLGYFKSLPYAALRLCREEIVSSADTVSLNEFARRINAINKQLLDQLEGVSV